MGTSIFTVNTDAYPDTDPAWLQDACGILPMWVAQYDMMSRMGAYDGSLVDYMTEAYGFGDLFEFKGVVDPDTQEYQSEYEEDEPLAPYGQVTMHDGKVALFYPYAITALPTANGYYVTRMD